MRTLDRRLTMPEVPERLGDDAAWSVFLPRRRTRWLYRVLAILIGISAGLTYAHFFVEGAGPLWKVAIGALGAVLGYVLVLMPAALTYHVRRLAAALAVRRRAAALKRAINRVRSAARSRLEEDQADASAWEKLGVASLLDGDTQRAAAAFEHACGPAGNGECRLNLAVALAETNQVDEATDLMLQVMDSSETARAARHNLGVLLSRHPRRDVFERVISELEGLPSPEILANLGAWELVHGDADLAERYLTRAVEADPAGVAPRANLGLLSYRRGNLKDAVEQLHEASYLDPMNPKLANDLGAILCAAGRPMAAARVLSRAAVLAPSSPEVELNRGCIRLSLGQYEDALESFTDPVVREEYPALSAHNAALALIGLGRLEAALEETQWGLERAPQDTGLLNNLGCLRWAEGDESEMVAIMSGLEETDEMGATLNLAAARIAAGQPNEALAKLERLRERGERDPLISFYRGLALLRKALDSYEPSMSRARREKFFAELHQCVRPFNAIASSDQVGAAEAQVNLALYRYLRLDFAEAVEGFAAAVSRFPEDGFLHFCLGTALAEEAKRIQEEHDADELVGQAREKLQRARKHLQRAVDLDEVTADAFCNLGMCAYDLGDTESALTAFKRMVQLEDSADANNNMAIVHAREGQRLQHQSRSAGLVSRQREGEMKTQAAKHLSTALHYFLQALEHNRSDPILHGNIGLAYMLRNRGSDVEAALRHWQRMLALGGERAGRRYKELSALATGDETRRAEFDETLMAFRSLDPRRCMVAVPPRLSGPRQALKPIAEDVQWRLLSSDPAITDLLRKRDRLAGLKQRLARRSI